ncbi:hypothetical protein K501DRAFT_289115 [Backusella circina FSU 941]|nr:hypothetical protein K501DRAFT_289115 [Backusella circina FSU 941]
MTNDSQKHVWSSPLIIDLLSGALGATISYLTVTLVSSNYESLSNSRYPMVLRQQRHTFA